MWTPEQEDRIYRRVGLIILSILGVALFVDGLATDNSWRIVVGLLVAGLGLLSPRLIGRFEIDIMRALKFKGELMSAPEHSHEPIAATAKIKKNARKRLRRQDVRELPSAPGRELEARRDDERKELQGGD